MTTAGESSIRNPPVSPWAPVDQLTGIGPKLTRVLADCGITRIVDFLLHIPRRYEDRTRVVALNETLVADRWVLVRGTFQRVSGRWAARRRMRIVSGLLTDDRGRLTVTWFNQPWVEERLREAGEVSLYGPIRKVRSGALQLINPEINEIDDSGDERIVPVYPALGPFKGRRLRKLIDQCSEAIDSCADPLPSQFRRQHDLIELGRALKMLHRPDVPTDEMACARLVDALNWRRTPAHQRLAFDELLAFSCGLAEYRANRRRQRAPECRVGSSYRELERRVLPFELTAAQRRTVEEIAADLEGAEPMSRLLQGDVGSGKTVVAALATLMMVDAGHQVAIMAPTELLAEQHFKTLTRMFSDTSIEMKLLTSSIPAAEQREVRAALDSGSTKLVVGTHSLVQSTVQFASLGLAVIDEQHRFGVAHRQSLVEKGDSPNLLVMTATPIPRSLALTVYGDLELSVIDELPPGRRPVTTVIRGQESKPKLFEFLRKEVGRGGRVYLVYPMIEANEDFDAPALKEHVRSVQQMMPGVGIGVLHGKMSRAERESVYGKFSRGEIEALLATTVVEVGVDVPEASVMVIEGADRFGLSQLHQLRGRVGRGTRKAWCILLADEGATEDAKRRLDVLCGTGDGFEIAEADLEIRGPGELTGTRQWGPGSFRFANLVRDRDLVSTAREVSRQLAETGDLQHIRDALARYHPVEIDMAAG